MSEEAFLAAIHAAPQDRTPRRVYADWLEERDDPRAELIRVEEEMRSVPIWSDRYWELKPLRNELRGRYDETWLQRMRYGTDCEPVFGDVPDHWRGRWRLIREFVERWHGVALGDVGRYAEEARQIGKQMGLTLPPSMGEWIAFTTDLGSVDNEVFRDCPEVKRLEDLSAVSLMIQGEADYWWAVRYENLGQADPPVDGWNLDYEAEGGSRFVHDRLFASRLTNFVFNYLTIYLHGDQGGFGREVDASPEFLDRLAVAFPVHAAFDDFHVFEAPNMLARVEDDYLHFVLFKKVPPEEVPACIRELAPQATARYGRGSLTIRPSDSGGDPVQ